MKPQPRPRSASSVVVGTKPLWELWAEAEAEKQKEGERLLKAGAFTAYDLSQKNGWNLERCRKYLEKQKLKNTLAHDHRRHHNPQVRFYFPPKP
jgi:hypothetical protein